MKFAITGKLSKERKYYEALLNKNGHTLGGISQTTAYLVVGDKPGNSKLNKASLYEIETINEEELLRMI